MERSFCDREEYDTLAAILDNAETISKRAVRESIIKNKDRLFLNLKLIQLDGIHTAPFDLEQMKYVYNRITTTEVLRGIGLKK